MRALVADLGTTLVFGSTGLLGSAFLRRLSCVGWSSADGDLRHRAVVEAAFARHHPRTVILCAAVVDGVGAQSKDPMRFVTDNLVMGTYLLEQAALRAESTRVLFVSSSTVYPESLTGAAADESWPLAPHPHYQGVGGVKVYLEGLCDFYHRKYGLDVRIIRPTAIYGPGDRSSHVIPDLLRRAEAGEDPLTVWGRPDTVRDFVFVDDVVDAGLAVLEHGAAGEVYNVGSGVPTTIAELAEAVLVATRGLDWVVSREERAAPLTVYDVSKPIAIARREVSIERAARRLGWAPKVPLAEGLKRTVAWMRRAKMEATS